VQRVRLGVVQAVLETRFAGLLREFAGLYESFTTDEPVAGEIRVRVEKQPVSLRHRARYQVNVNDRLIFEPTRPDELLPYVEWVTNWEVPRALPDYLHLHASSLEVNGQGVILPGDSGSGKSTLALGLLTRGWRYLCDEFALIHGRHRTLAPFPRALCIKRPSYPVAESLGIELAGRPHYLKGAKGYVRFLSPCEISPHGIGRPCPIRYVIFPTYTAGAEPTLTPMTRAEGAFALHKVCFNLFGCKQLGLDVLADVVRGADCYRLVSGEIHRTCDLVEGLVTEGAAGAAELSRQCVAV